MFAIILPLFSMWASRYDMLTLILATVLLAAICLKLLRSVDLL